MRGTDAMAKTPYTEDWNLSVERSLTSDLVGTVSYVGNGSRHLEVNIDINTPLALETHGANTQPANPMPDYGGSAYAGYSGMSDYEALQAKLEKRMSKGYNLLATYTWGKALDDAVTPLGSTGDGNYRQTNLLGIREDYSHASFDVRQRFTFTGLYELPFGTGRAFANQSKLLDEFVGGWSANAVFTAQTGQYFTVSPSGVSTAAGFENGPFTYQVAGEFATGGTQTTEPGNASNCASSVKNHNSWYNPCSYASPWDAGTKTFADGSPNTHYIPKNASDTLPTGDTTPVYVTDPAMIRGYAGGKRDIAVGPGMERVNMSIFKDFRVYREQKLTFRADIFNLFNTPSWAQPSGNNSSSGAEITGTRSLQKDAPDSRFLQLSLKYAF
jgi:hypothetical protein